MYADLTLPLFTRYSLIQHTLRFDIEKKYKLTNVINLVFCKSTKKENGCPDARDSLDMK